MKIKVILYCICVYTRMCHNVCGVQKTTFRGQLSPYSMCPRDLTRVVRPSTHFLYPRIIFRNTEKFIN